MTSFIISAAKISDVPDIAKVQVESWQQAYRDIVPADYLSALSTQPREAHWTQSLSNGNPSLIVAKTSVQLVGWIAFGQSRDDDACDKTGEIEAVYVLPAYWSSGAGRALWEHAMPKLVQRGFDTVTLWVMVENDRAIKFYRRAGFKPEPASIKNFTIGSKDQFK